MVLFDLSVRFDRNFQLLKNTAMNFFGLFTAQQDFFWKYKVSSLALTCYAPWLSLCDQTKLRLGKISRITESGFSDMWFYEL